MIAPMKSFSLTALLVNIGGVPISGYSDGDAITFEDIEHITMQDGSDGLSVACYKKIARQKATIRLMQHSKSYTALMGILEAQKAILESTGIITPLPFGYVDPSTGTAVTSAYCVFTKTPGFSAGETPSAIEFEMQISPPISMRGAANIL